MKPADLSAVFTIEQEQPFPWSKQTLQDCLQADYSCWILEKGSELIGFAILLLGVEQAEIINIAIKKTERRQGYGKKLLQHLIHVACENKKSKIFLEVRCSNIAAQRLYTQCGFKWINTRENYYPTHNGREDALVLIYDKPH